MSNLESRRRFLKGIAAAGTVAVLPGCVTTNKATGRTSFTGIYSVEDDIALGRREHPKLVEAFGGEYEHGGLHRYVSRVGESLAVATEYQQFTYRFTLLNSPIVNAFALPGGYVYITRGLMVLASNEAEMAGVLAHELGHVNARHTAERMSASALAQIGLIAGSIGAAVVGLPSGVMQVGEQIVMLSIQSYSRKQEFEADMLGVRYMSKAGYGPEAMATFLGTLREQSIVEAKTLGLPAGTVDQFNMMSTHPRTLDRVKEATAAAEVQKPADPRIARDVYLKEVDGMMFGDDPRQGIVMGRRFVHPGMRFEFMLPEGFRVDNMPERVVAQDGLGAGILFDIAPIPGGVGMPAYVSRDWGGEIGVRDVAAFQVNGLEAGSGWTPLQSGEQILWVTLVAIRRDRNSAFRLTYLVPERRASALSDAFQATTDSFRKLSEEKAAAVKPLRVNVVEAAPGDRVSRLSKYLPYGRHNDDWFRVINDMAEGEEPTPGQTLKVIRT